MVQRGAVLLITSADPEHIRGFDISMLCEEAMQEIQSRVTTSVRLSAVAVTGMMGA
jgi:hypothetical protein